MTTQLLILSAALFAAAPVLGAVGPMTGSSIAAPAGTSSTGAAHYSGPSGGGAHVGGGNVGSHGGGNLGGRSAAASARGALAVHAGARASRAAEIEHRATESPAKTVAMRPHPRLFRHEPRYNALSHMQLHPCISVDDPLRQTDCWGPTKTASHAAR